jgi:hypothetical protein
VQKKSTLQLQLMISNTLRTLKSLKCSLKLSNLLHSLQGIVTMLCAIQTLNVQSKVCIAHSVKVLHPNSSSNITAQ